MLPRWARALLLLQLVLLGASVDWCSLRCDEGYLHTMCGFEGVRRQCRNVQNTMTPSKRADLLHWHNSYRNSIAEGRFGVTGMDISGVANMRQMTYYDDLETIAQKWADQCIPAHDVCRTTPRFEDDKGFNSGQNFGTQKSDLKMPSDEMTWYNFLEWTNERMNVPAAELASFGQTNGNQQETWSHWTQLVWANSYTLGCAEVVYEVGGQFERTTFCNYGPGGNLRGRKAFKVGPPCSRCPRGTSCRADSDYPSLCALQGDPKVREDFITSPPPLTYPKSDQLSSSEEREDAKNAHLRSLGKHKGRYREGPDREKTIIANVEKHKEPGKHEPEPEKHDEPGEHEPKSVKHKEPGKHEPNKPKKHKEPGEHEPVLEKHKEPGEHEPAPEEHMEPGEHEEMPMEHVEPGRHEEMDPESGYTEHKEPGWHEPLAEKHREPSVHEPVPEKHIEPGNHEPASPKKHKEPGIHEPKKPINHTEPGEHGPELEQHKEPGEHEPEPMEHDEPGEHEEAQSMIFYGGRAGPDAAAPDAGDPSSTSTPVPMQNIPENWQQHDGPDLPPLLPLPGEIVSPDLTEKRAEGEKGPLQLRSNGGEKNGTSRGDKNGTPNSAVRTSGCENKRMTARNGLGAFSVVMAGLIYAWFGGMIFLVERLL